MKISALVLFFCLAAAPAQAQSPILEAPPAPEATPPPAARKLPATLEPTPTPAPVGDTAAPAAPARSPDEVAATFFERLKADRVEEAYASISTQSAISDRAQEEREQMTKRTQSALDAYGPVEGFELLSEETAGEHLMRRTYLLLCDKLPLRWKLYFYKNSAGWNLVDLRVDDALVETIDEATRPAR